MNINNLYIYSYCKSANLTIEGGRLRKSSQIGKH